VDKLVGITGIATPVNSRVNFGATILIEAMEDGWWYSAPLADNRILATFMTDVDMVTGGPARWSRHWLERLTRSTHTIRRLGKFASIDHVWVGPAQSQTLSATYGEGWLTIGDASAAFDPLSSQGMTSGIADSALAGDAIRRYLTGDGVNALRDYGHRVETSFRKYLTERTEYYRLEKRWPSSTFWRRRHQSIEFSPAV
jgi:flavin-dependent dehydrogenase